MNIVTSRMRLSLWLSSYVCESVGVRWGGAVLSSGKIQGYGQGQNIGLQLPVWAPCMGVPVKGGLW